MALSKQRIYQNMEKYRGFNANSNIFATISQSIYIEATARGLTTIRDFLLYLKFNQKLRVAEYPNYGLIFEIANPTNGDYISIQTERSTRARCYNGQTLGNVTFDSWILNNLIPTTLIFRSLNGVVELYINRSLKNRQSGWLGFAASFENYKIRLCRAMTLNNINTTGLIYEQFALFNTGDDDILNALLQNQKPYDNKNCITWLDFHEDNIYYDVDFVNFRYGDKSGKGNHGLIKNYNTQTNLAVIEPVEYQNTKSLDWSYDKLSYLRGESCMFTARRSTGVGTNVTIQTLQNQRLLLAVR